MADTINIYEPVTMLRAVEVIKPVYTFFRDTFFAPTDTQVTETVLVDTYKNKRKMAPFVAPRVGGITMLREGYTTASIKTPRIAPQRKLTVDDLRTRAIGESIISTRTPEDRAKVLLAKDMLELKDMNTRRTEWMCREIITTGKVTIKGYVDETTITEEYEVDFGFTNTATNLTTDRWSDTTNSNPIAQLSAIRVAQIKATGQAPEVVIMASDAAALFMAHPKVVALTDKQKIKTIDIQPTIISPAVRFIGRVLELAMDIYAYDEWFINDSGVETAMVPSKTAIIGRKDLGRVIYGAITQMEEDQEYHTYEGADIPKMWADTANDAKMIRLSSRPLPAPFNVDSWNVLVVD